MKKLLIQFMAVAMIFTGCSLLEKEPTANDIVSEAFKNLEGMDYYDYEFEFGGVMIAEGEAVDFSIKYVGEQDNTDKAKPKFTMGIDVELSVEEFENQKIGGELRSDGDYLYFILNEISDFDGELPAEMVDPYKGQWYSLSLTDDTLGAIAPFTTFQMNDEENMTEDQKELMALYEDTDFFKDVEFVKSEDGFDIYTGVLDKKASKKFLEKAMEMQGQAFTGTEEEGFDDFMDSVELDVMMYVNKAENVLTKATGTMVMEDLGKAEDMEGVDGDFDFSMEFMNLGEPVVIEAPADVEEFDPMMIFAAMMGMDPAAMEGMMEEAAMMDEEPIPEESVIIDDEYIFGEELYKNEFGITEEEINEITKDLEAAMEGIEGVELVEIEY